MSIFKMVLRPEQGLARVKARVGNDCQKTVRKNTPHMLYLFFKLNKKSLNLQGGLT
jgi:hypothetical protein